MFYLLNNLNFYIAAQQRNPPRQQRPRPRYYSLNIYLELYFCKNNIKIYFETEVLLEN